MSRGPRRDPGALLPPPGAPDPLLSLASLTGELRWEEIFGRAAPVEVEIGSGKGNTLIQMAEEHTGVDFLGIEVGVKWVRLARARLIRAGATNARIAAGEAEWILGRYVPRASVRRLHVYFPDPWPKKRHAKRRLFREGFPALAQRCLQASGEVRVATDHAAYEAQIRAVMAGGGFTPVPDPVWEDEPVSAFECKYREQGRRIYRMTFRPPPPGRA